jgi:hypothetical protein
MAGQSTTGGLESAGGAPAYGLGFSSSTAIGSAARPPKSASKPAGSQLGLGLGLGVGLGLGALQQQPRSGGGLAASPFSPSASNPLASPGISAATSFGLGALGGGFGSAAKGRLSFGGRGSLGGVQKAGTGAAETGGEGEAQEDAGTLGAEREATAPTPGSGLASRKTFASPSPFGIGSGLGASTSSFSSRSGFPASATGGQVANFSSSAASFSAPVPQAPAVATGISAAAIGHGVESPVLRRPGQAPQSIFRHENIAANAKRRKQQQASEDGANAGCLSRCGARSRAALKLLFGC